MFFTIVLANIHDILIEQNNSRSVVVRVTVVWCREDANDSRKSTWCLLVQVETFPLCLMSSNDGGEFILRDKLARGGVAVDVGAASR